MAYYQIYINGQGFVYQNDTCQFVDQDGNECDKPTLKKYCSKHAWSMRNFSCQACQKDYSDSFKEKIAKHLTRNFEETDFCEKHWDELRQLARNVEITRCLGERHYGEYLYSGGSALCGQATLPGKPYCAYHMKTNGHP